MFELKSAIATNNTADTELTITECLNSCSHSDVFPAPIAIATKGVTAYDIPSPMIIIIIKILFARDAAAR